MREAAGRYVAFDGKLWRTLAALLFRPGFLTCEYFAGRRRRYVRPARLFLASSLVLFAVLRVVSDPTVELIVADPPRASTPDKAPAAPARGPKAAGGEAAAATDGATETVPLGAGVGFTFDDKLNVDVTGLPGEFDAVRRRLARFNRLPHDEKLEAVMSGVLRYGPYAMFVLLPAFAALLKLVYLGRRRRHPDRPRLYGEHLVFAAHDHAFVFTMVALATVVPAGLRGPVMAWLTIYLFWSLRAVYGGSWLGAIVRGGTLFVAYLVLFGLAVAGLLLAAVVLR
jgi:hypothetical protein